MSATSRGAERVCDKADGARAGSRRSDGPLATQYQLCFLKKLGDRARPLGRDAGAAGRWRQYRGAWGAAAGAWLGRAQPSGTLHRLKPRPRFRDAAALLAGRPAELRPGWLRSPFLCCLPCSPFLCWCACCPFSLCCRFARTSCRAAGLSPLPPPQGRHNGFLQYVRPPLRDVRAVKFLRSLADRFAHMNRVNDYLIIPMA
jgi:hypothetical protein